MRVNKESLEVNLSQFARKEEVSFDSFVDSFVLFCPSFGLKTVCFEVWFRRRLSPTIVACQLPLIVHGLCLDLSPFMDSADSVLPLLFCNCYRTLL